MLANQTVGIQQKMTATFPSEDLENIQYFSASPTNNYTALNWNALHLALFTEGHYLLTGVGFFMDTVCLSHSLSHVYTHKISLISRQLFYPLCFDFYKCTIQALYRRVVGIKGKKK